MPRKLKESLHPQKASPHHRRTPEEWRQEAAALCREGKPELARKCEMLAGVIERKRDYMLRINDTRYRKG